MKNLVNLLLGLSVVSMLIALISRLTLKPILGIESRAMVGFVAILLLFVIALSVKK
jgi:hypothetical protein